MTRSSYVIAVLALVILTGSCSRLVKVSDTSIPRLLTPVATSGFDDLTRQLQPFTGLQSLRAWSVYIRFIDAESAERFREAEAIMVLQRPDKIRLVVQAPVVKTKIAEMVSESNHFKVAIYPSDFQRFLIGTNDADYSKWLEKLGEKGKSALVSARPFHFTEALMISPIETGNPRLAYGIEEALVEETNTEKGQPKNQRVLRSFYVISEFELSQDQPGRARVRRRFWFDRNNGARFSKQQLFDSQGNLATEVIYSDHKRLSADSDVLWPGVILVNRPHDFYSARLTFSEERFEVNTELPPNAFELVNTDGLPETDLDKPPQPQP